VLVETRHQYDTRILHQNIGLLGVPSLIRRQA
jgi:hypothetical protein